jgi:hypothetical protein
LEFDKLLVLLRTFDEEAVEYVLVGGAALNLHGLVRATVDVDFFVRPEAVNVERIRRALRRVWDDPEIDGIVVEDLAGDYAVVRYGPPDETLVVDLIARVGEMFSFDDIEWSTVDVEGVPARVATPRMLYRLKRDTARPIDRADAAALKAKFDLTEEG